MPIPSQLRTRCAWLLLGCDWASGAGGAAVCRLRGDGAAACLRTVCPSRTARLSANRTRKSPERFCTFLIEQGPVTRCRCVSRITTQRDTQQLRRNGSRHTGWCRKIAVSIPRDERRVQGRQGALCAVGLTWTRMLTLTAPLHRSGSQKKLKTVLVKLVSTAGAIVRVFGCCRASL